MSTATHQAPAPAAEDVKPSSKRRPTRAFVSPERARRIRWSRRQEALEAAKPWRDSRNW